MNPDGSFFVAWQSGDQDGDQAGVFGRSFSAEAVPLTADQQINIYTPGQQDQIELGGNGAGDFLVVWLDRDGRDGDGFGAIGRRLGPADLFADGFESGGTAAWSTVVP